MSVAPETVELPVAGMTCNHCVGSVRHALEDVPGVKEARVNLEAGRAEIVLEPGSSVDRDRLKAAIEEAGYNVPAPAATETWKLAVEGMHCASCVGRVQTALTGVPGVVTAGVDLEGRSAEVVVEPSQVAEDDLVRAVDAAGYRAHRVASRPVEIPAPSPPTNPVTIGPPTAKTTAPRRNPDRQRPRGVESRHRRDALR